MSLELEMDEWFKNIGRYNERILKRKQQFDEEVQIQFFMYRFGYANREYAKKLMRFYAELGVVLH